MGEIFVLALASALWPLLLAVVVIAFGSAQPMRLLASFLAGGLLATVVVGVAVVHLIQTTSIQIGSRQESRAVLPLLLGFAAIGTAIVLARRSPPPPSRCRPPAPRRKARDAWPDGSMAASGSPSSAASSSTVPGRAPTDGAQGHR